MALLLAFTAVPAVASPGGSLCDPQLGKNIPARADGALTGTEFAERARDLAGPQRDALVRTELLAGNVITVCVLPDYLVPYLVAAACSFLTGTVLVYWASIRHIFGFRRLASARNEFAIFVAVGLVGLAINLGVIYIGVSRLGLHYLVAKGGAAGFTFLANFAMRRWLLFTPWARLSSARPTDQR